MRTRKTLEAMIDLYRQAVVYGLGGLVLAALVVHETWWRYGADQAGLTLLAIVACDLMASANHKANKAEILGLKGDAK